MTETTAWRGGGRAAAHRVVDPDEAHVEGKRWRWMRWIGRSTHEADRDRIAMGRTWWLWSKLALPIGLAVRGALGETLKLHLEVKQAEMERLGAETAASRTSVPAKKGDGR